MKPEIKSVMYVFTDNGGRGSLPVAVIVSSILFVISFALRYFIVYSFQFPPGGDGAGDTVIARGILAHGISYPATTEPLYFILVMMPLISFFPAVSVIKFLIVFMPALLVFPSFFIFRQLKVNTVVASLGSLAMGTSAAISMMVTWNSAYNTFAILLLLFFILFLIRFLEDGQLKSLILSTVFLSLVAATHELTFLIALIMLPFPLLYHISRVGPRKWSRQILKFLGLFLLEAAILAPIYLYNLTTLTNLGRSHNTGLNASVGIILGRFMGGVYFALGYNPPYRITYNAATFDFFISVISIVLIFVSSRFRYIAFVLLGIVVGSFAFTYINPYNYVRGFYFLAIPCIFAPFLLLDIILANLSRIGKWLSSSGRSIFSRVSVVVKASVNFLVVLMAIIIVVSSISISTSILKQGDAFYQELSPNGYQAIEWISHNVPENSTLFADSMGYWPAAVSGINEVSPSVLTSKVTASSYKLARLADMVYMGNYVIGSNSALLAFDSPYQSYNMINIYSSGFWYPVLYFNPSFSYAIFKLGNVTYKECLGNSSSNVMSLYNDSGSTHIGMTYRWLNLSSVLSESVLYSKDNITIAWQSNNGDLVSVDLAFTVPGSSLVNYQSTNGTSLTLSMSVNNEIGALTINEQGGSVNQSQKNNSYNIYANGSTLEKLTLSSFGSYVNNGYFSFNSLNISRSMGINYYLINSSTDPLLFQRLLYMNYSGIAMSYDVYNNSPFHVFKLVYA